MLLIENKFDVYLTSLDTKGTLERAYFVPNCRANKGNKTEYSCLIQIFGKKEYTFLFYTVFKKEGGKLT